MVKIKKVVKDKIAGKMMLIISALLALLLLLIVINLLLQSFPIFKNNSFWNLITSTEWQPMNGKFGMLTFIAGTLWVTAISIIMAVPTCLLASIYLSEYAKTRMLNLVNPLIDILAGIPSVVFGVFGVIFIVPIIRNYIAPFFGISSTGYSVLAGGLVLSIMTVPVIMHVLTEVFKSVPQELREAALSLGATKWETIKLVVLKKAMPGIIAAIVLGISRAFGETMAVLMVVGNVVKIPHSLFDAGYPLPALIANNYGEMLSIPSCESALMFSALILLIIVILFNVLSRLALVRIEKMVGA